MVGIEQGAGGLRLGGVGLGCTADVNYEGSLELVFHCSARDKARGLDLGKKRERRRSICHCVLNLFYTNHKKSVSQFKINMRER